MSRARLKIPNWNRFAEIDLVVEAEALDAYELRLIDVHQDVVLPPEEGAPRLPPTTPY